VLVQRRESLANCVIALVNGRHQNMFPRALRQNRIVRKVVPGIAQPLHSHGVGDSALLKSAFLEITQYRKIKLILSDSGPIDWTGKGGARQTYWQHEHDLLEPWVVLGNKDLRAGCPHVAKR